MHLLVKQLILATVVTACSGDFKSTPPADETTDNLNIRDPDKTDEDGPPLPEQSLPSPPETDLVRPDPESLPPFFARDLPQTSRSCNDSDFGKGRLEACLKSPKPLLRFENILIQFSISRSRGNVEELDFDSVTKNLRILDQQGQQVDGKTYWQDTRTLIFDPLLPLEASQTYDIEILSLAGDPQRPHSDKHRALHPFKDSLTTKAAYVFSHELNGIEVNELRGITFDKRSYPSVILESRLSKFEGIDEITLRKIGQREPYQICQKNCPQLIRTDLNKYGVLQPEPGVNTYTYELKAGDDLVQTSQVSFNWGNIASDPHASFKRGMAAAIDLEDTMPVLGNLLNEFGGGSFTLDYIDEAGQTHKAQTFNDIIAFDKRNYSEGIPDRCRPAASSNFTYIADLGPFCEIDVEGSQPILIGLLGNVRYKATADIYVTEMIVDKEEDNLDVGFGSYEDKLDLSLKVKKFRGKLKIIVNISEAKHPIIPLRSALGNFVFETTFVLDGSPKETFARTRLINDDGNLKIAIHQLEEFNLDTPVNGSPDRLGYFNTDQWVRNVNVATPILLDESNNLWTQVVNFVVKQAVTEKVDEFTPGIVNGIARDMIQVVAPNALNTLVKRMRSGLTIPFPDFLPSPLDRIRAQVSGSLNGPIETLDGYITSFVDGKLGLLPDPLLIPPPKPAGPLSYVQIAPEGFTPPHPLDGPTPEGIGSVVSLNLDLLNQVIFKLWQQGIFNLTITKEFIETIEEFAVLDPANSQNGKEILFAEFIPKLMGNKIERMIAIDEQGNSTTMDKDDEIRITLTPLLPPVLQAIKPDDSDDYIPEFNLSFGDFLMTIRGYRGDISYDITTIKLALSSASTISFRSYSNPYQLQKFSGVGAMSIQVLSDAKNLDYTAEVFNDRQRNPFGINTGKLKNAIVDMVDSLFIPLFNDALREVPLVGLRTCGIEVDASRVQLLPISGQVKTPYLRVQAPLKSYEFQGNCALEPDLTTPLPPLPEPDPGTDPEPQPDPEPGDSSLLDMDFSALPFALGESGVVPQVHPDCQSSIFFEVSCARGNVEFYKNDDGSLKLDDRGRPIYHYTAIQLVALVSKADYVLRKGDKPSLEGQFFAFEKWPQYVSNATEHITFNESLSMGPVDTPSGQFIRHYADYASNSPKASGFIPIRNVTYNRILPSAFAGAEISTEFFVNTSSFVEVPEGRAALQGADGIEFHVGNVHLMDCGNVGWCQDSSQWLVFYDTKISPEDKSIPEDVVPYLKTALNSIISGMFAPENRQN